jgi:hypothetical protein
MVEFMLGRLCAQLPPGTRIGFIEPVFRGPLARLAHLETTGRPELAPLRTWAVAINELYLVNRISPAVGATLGRALEQAGCRNVQSTWTECRSDNLMLDNMVMFYEEVRDRLEAHGIMSAAEVTRQQELLRGLALDNLPAVWGSFRVTAET